MAIPLDFNAIQQALQKMNAEQQAKTAARNAVVGKLAQQLMGQSQQYGFSWKGNKSADFHTNTLAGILADKGVTDLKQIGYSQDGKDLINKTTGQRIPWNYSRHKKREQPGQIGWSAAGVGRTNYMVKRDAAGNPVFTPQWKSNAPGGLGGFLLDVAPIALGAIPGVGALGGAAIAGGLTAARGGDIGDILKSAGASYLGGEAGGLAKQAAGGALGQAGGSALGGAASGATRAALSGQDILGGALRGGIAGGVTDLGMQGYRDLTSTPGLTTSGAEGGLKFNPRSGGEYVPGQADYGLTSDTNQGEGLRFGGQPSGQGLNFDPGAFQTGLMYDQPSPTQARYGTTQGLGRVADSLARGTIGAGLNYLLSPDVRTARASQRAPNQTQYIGPTSAGPLVQYGAVPKNLGGGVTTVATQGLGGYSPGEIESQSTGGPRQNPWNEASLRLKDALGA